MILAWLTTRFLGFSRGWWLLAAALALAGLWIALSARENADDQHNQSIGRDQEVARQLDQTVRNVKESIDARDEVRDSRSCAKFVQCVRSARDGSVCVRYLPDGETVDRCARAGAGR